MYDNQYDLDAGGGVDPLGLCPCKSNHCTHACTAMGASCMRSCSGSCAATCSSQCSYIKVVQLL